MNHIIKSKYLAIEKADYPQYVIKANAEDILAIAESFHKTIEKYPDYSEAINLIDNSSEFTVDNIVEKLGTDPDNYDFPMVIGAFACEINDKLEIDVSHITPYSSAEQFFCIERLLKSQPMRQFEAFVTILTEELYPEQLTSICDEVLSIIRRITGYEIKEIYLTKKINDLIQTEKWPELIDEINTSFDIQYEIEDLARISGAFSLVNSIYLKKLWRMDISGNETQD